MIVLKMSKSFFDNEDTNLAHKLEQELGGIFNWAMEGLKRRLARGGHFLQPKSGKEYLDLMEELGNPMKPFGDDALEFDPKSWTRKEDVFACWKHWALRKYMSPGTEQAFKRRFLAATQEKYVTSFQMQINGDRIQVYMGVKLNDKAQKYLDSVETFNEGVF
jgi:putative DNA primase/helicase